MGMAREQGSIALRGKRGAEHRAHDITRRGRGDSLRPLGGAMTVTVVFGDRVGEMATISVLILTRCGKVSP